MSRQMIPSPSTEKGEVRGKTSTNQWLFPSCGPTGHFAGKTEPAPRFPDYNRLAIANASASKSLAIGLRTWDERTCLDSSYLPWALSWPPSHRCWHSQRGQTQV